MTKVRPQRLHEPQRRAWWLHCGPRVHEPGASPDAPGARCSRVVLQKPVPLTPSLGRAYARAVVLFF